ncbi:MAG TPA: carboxypeptidase regulatory-like domain-containing protein [Chthoniobacterales bacterium]|nr:carboxypeptidase regulatory-like domain-containing protein [Chthoniobacterales bacterium]
MRTRRLLLTLLVASSAAFLSQVGHSQISNQTQTSAALTGQVTSTEEGLMEGVLVTVKKTGSTIAITVATDEQGRYRFPPGRLEPGHYAISIRAVGYDLDGPTTVDISAPKPSTADLKLRNTANLSMQLTNAEWIESVPGTPEQKSSLRNCVTCHTLQRPIRSAHDADEFVQVQQRMASYVNQSIPEAPQTRLAERLANQQERGEEGGQTRQQENRRRMAEFLSSINLSKGPEWIYPLKTFPRPKGRATHVIITEYDLPKPTRQPHDVMVDSDGIAWYISFGEQIIGKLDPRTGKTAEFSVPVLKPGSPLGELALRSDEDRNLWIGMMYQGAVGKFDTKTEKFQTWSLPPEDNKDYTQINQIDPMHSKVDGKVWVQDAGEYTLRRLDPVSGKFEIFRPFPAPSPNIYDIISDSQNNGYFTVFGADQIGKIDAKTGKITLYKTPTPNSAPRRGSMDSRGQFWFAEYRGNRIGMFDTETERFKEWVPPTPWAQPYDVVADKNGEAWAGSLFTDRVTRLDPKTGQMTDYLLPRSTNIRRVFVDNSTTPVTFWVGNDHGASIIRLEPLH